MLSRWIYFPIYIYLKFPNLSHFSLFCSIILFVFKAKDFYQAQRIFRRTQHWFVAIKMKKHIKINRLKESVIGSCVCDLAISSLFKVMLEHFLGFLGLLGYSETHFQFLMSSNLIKLLSTSFFPCDLLKKCQSSSYRICVTTALKV